MCRVCIFETGTAIRAPSVAILHPWDVSEDLVLALLVRDALVAAATTAGQQVSYSTSHLQALL